MTLDEYIDKLESELAHFVETEQWWSAIQANENLKKAIILKKDIGYVTIIIKETDEPKTLDEVTNEMD